MNGISKSKKSVMNLTYTIEELVVDSTHQASRFHQHSQRDKEDEVKPNYYHEQPTQTPIHTQSPNEHDKENVDFALKRNNHYNHQKSCPLLSTLRKTDHQVTPTTSQGAHSSCVLERKMSKMKCVNSFSKTPQTIVKPADSFKINRTIPKIIVTCYDESNVVDGPKIDLLSSDQIDHNNNNFDGSSVVETKNKNPINEMQSQIQEMRSSEKQVKIIRKNITPKLVTDIEVNQFHSNDECFHAKGNDLNNKRAQRDKKIKTLIYEEQNRAVLIENTNEHMVKIKQYENLKKKLDFDEDQVSIEEKRSEIFPITDGKETVMQTIKTREYVLDADSTSNSPCVSTETSPYNYYLISKEKQPVLVETEYFETKHSTNMNKNRSSSRSSSVSSFHTGVLNHQKQQQHQQQKQRNNLPSGSRSEEKFYEQIEENFCKQSAVSNDSNKLISTDSNSNTNLKETDVYENDEYNFNCLRTKLIPTEINCAIQPTQKLDLITNTLSPKKNPVFEDNGKTLQQSDDFITNTYVYYYTDKECYNRIFETRKIECEPMIYENELIDAIIFLTLSPETCDKELLTVLYGPNSPVSWTKVQCCIQIRSSSLMNFKDRLIKINNVKYAFKKNIKFTTVFPKHQFRPNYRPIH